MNLRLATPEDFPFIRQIAGRAENRPFISDDNETTLQAYLSNPMSMLAIWEQCGRPAGFCLYAGLGCPSNTLVLLRLALDKPGTGQGAAFMEDLIWFGFDILQAQRLWLDVASDNTRAIHLYEHVGFIKEGILRRHWMRPTGTLSDVAVLGLLREEWQHKNMPIGTVSTADLAPTAPQAYI